MGNGTFVGWIYRCISCTYFPSPLTSLFIAFSHSPNTTRLCRSVAYKLTAVLKLLPAYTALSPSSSSIRRIWLSLARRSDRAGAPVLI
jgi:hypothetical protein